MKHARLFVGSVALACGIAIVLFGMHKAAIVIAAAGLVFVLAGLLVLGPARWQLPLATLMVTALALVFDWVAFGPGERHFTGSVGAGSVQASWASGEYAGRAFFGLFALLFDIAAVGLWIKVVRMRPAPDSLPER